MSDIPRAVGLIMDGNRRWAKAQSRPVAEGHREGLDTARRIVRAAHTAGVEEVTLYAFSSENWKREPEEVAFLMGLIEVAFTEWLDEFIEEGGRIRFIGERGRLPETARQRIEEGEHKSAAGTGGLLIIALSYGGRAEITAAVNSLLESEKRAITEEDIASHLWTEGMRDPDLIIRTGGQQRLSNFLPWQSVYSELIFTETLWPAYSPTELEQHFELYRERKRNFGV